MRSASTLGVLGLACVLVSSLACAGCVRRTIMITSEPDGALVYLNDREIGRTPVEVDFLWYGEYDVRLLREGYEPLLTSGKARAPVWDSIPFDLLAEAVPGEPHSRIHWHYELEPVVDDPAALLERANALRERSAEGVPPPAEEAPSDNAEAAGDETGQPSGEDADPGP